MSTIQEGLTLFSRFNKQIKTIFLDASSSDFHTDEHVNVILSPSLYWVKRVKLPVKYIREVKPLLPSLFEDILPDGNYSYSAYKEGEEFYIFAYEDKAIIELLSQKGLQISQVKNVYFSQSELSSIQNPLLLDEVQSLCLRDNIVVVLPSDWVENSQTLDFNTLKLSKNSIKLKQYGHIVTDKSLYQLIAIASVLLILVGAEYVITTMKAKTLEESRYALFSKNSLKSTMMQNRSMLSSYERTYKQQTKIRNYLYQILSLPLSSPQKLALVQLKRDKLIAEFSGVQGGAERNIANALKKKGLNFKATFKNATLHLEVIL